MISKKSAIIYVYINGILILISYGQYTFLNNFLVLFIYTTLRNLGLVYFIDSAIHTRRINDTYVEASGTVGEFEAHVAQAAAIESLTLYGFQTFLVDVERPLTLVWFIPMSFVFEVIFDFFHYWTHRGLHLTHLSWHKHHHSHIHLKSILAYYHNPLDVILTQIIPFMAAYLSMSGVYPFTMFDLCMLMTYKSYTEIAGHTGYMSFPISSFPQCIWLPKVLGIDLYTEDHNRHHTDPTCNFSKRFTLWDKVFGTWR